MQTVEKFVDFNGGKAKKARIGRRAVSDDREGVALLPKVSVRTVVSSDMVDTIVDNVVERLGGGTFGNGKIFVRPVTGAVRLRTNERGEPALKMSQRDHISLAQMKSPLVFSSMRALASAVARSSTS